MRFGMRLFSLHSSALFLLFVVSPVLAQVTVVEDEENSLTIYRVVVSSAAEPEPAFKNRLLKHEDVRKHGNAAPYYYRAQMELDRALEAVRKEFGDKYDEWYGVETPLVDLPKEKVRKALLDFDGTVMEGLREATSRQYCDWDWGVRDFQGMKLFSFVMEEVSRSRELARIVTLRTRLALAEGRLDDALSFLQMNYQLGRDIAKPRVLVCGLVGIAVVSRTDTSTLEFIAHPDSPNLYWAIAELPKPMIDLRPAMRFELGNGPRFLPLLQDAETMQHSPQEWSRYIGESFDVMSCLRRGGIETDDGLPLALRGAQWEQARLKLIGTAVGLWGYTRAKRELAASGMPVEEVEAMPAGRAVVLQASRAYRHTAQTMEKLWCMPFPEMVRRTAAIEEQLQREGYLGGKMGSKEIIPVASLLLPAISVARVVQERLSRELVAMQVIEALRMHAAETGELPDSLDEVSIVPVPDNPATGRAFVYRTRMDDGRRTAILELPKTDGFRRGDRRYEITLRVPE